MPERITRQFKKLQKTGPSNVWTENTRYFLVNQVKQETIGYESSWLNSFKLLSFIWVRRLVPSPVKIVSVLSIVALIGGTNLIAQAEIVPKTTFYEVKRSIEKIEMLFALTPQSEAKINLRHATKRKEEAVKLAQKTEFTPEEKEKHINTVVKSLEYSISAAQNSLEIVKEEKKSEKTVKLAKEITKNISDNIEGLNEVKEIASLEGVNKVVSKVQDELEEAGDDSIKVLIEEVNKSVSEEAIDPAEEQKDTIEITRKVISEEELKEIINKKIERIDKKLKEIEEVVKQFDSEEVIKEQIETGALNVDLEEVSNVIKRLIEAQEILEEAKSLLDEGLQDKALKKVIEANKIVIESQGIMAKIGGILSEEVVEELIDETSTSTEEIIIEEVTEVDSATTTMGTTPQILDSEIVNFAPLGGKVNQSATDTEDLDITKLKLLEIDEKEE